MSNPDSLRSPLPLDSSFPFPMTTTSSSPLSSDVHLTTSSDWSRSSSAQSKHTDGSKSSSKLTHLSGSVPSLLRWNAQAETRTLIDVLEGAHRGQSQWQNLPDPDRPIPQTTPYEDEVETRVTTRTSRHRHRHRRSHSCRRARSHEVYQEEELTKDFFLIVTLCFVLACFLVCLGRPIALARVFDEMAET
ncbi:hypothetical protein VKT23_013151 [Stygiomarasmius scandens]|uniref:Uncharacterized protein n=1 Tax=Marasmiellus scandens TaxID=2682957 RepID=A0ABR1J3R0_9AGAR